MALALCQPTTGLEPIPWPQRATCYHLHHIGIWCYLGLQLPSHTRRAICITCILLRVCLLRNCPTPNFISVCHIWKRAIYYSLLTVEEFHSSLWFSDNNLWFNPLLWSADQMLVSHPNFALFDSYLRFPFVITLCSITDETFLRSSRHLLLRRT